jgi:Ca2+-binding RTX toxin-like protein
MRRAGLGTLIAALFLVVPSVASAAKVFVPQNSPPFPNKPAVFLAGVGETNDLSVTEVNGQLVFFDSLAFLIAGTDCTKQLNSSVTCIPDATNVEAHLKDGDDTAHLTISRTGTLWAGSGDDNVIADSFGNFTRVYGQGGDDEISAGGEGQQLADGGSGDDIVHAGGFAGNGTGLGGSGADIIYFRTFLNGLATLDGGTGDDTIVSQPAGGIATGGTGDDIIAIHGQIPQMGGAGFTVSGGTGDDTIIGNAFADTIHGGAGRDYIDVLNGGADTVDCGSGTDVVRFDATDTVAADCEILLGP